MEHETETTEKLSYLIFNLSRVIHLFGGIKYLNTHYCKVKR